MKNSSGESLLIQTYIHKAVSPSIKEKSNHLLLTQSTFQGKGKM